MQKVLIIEDEPDIRELVRLNLERAGIEVGEAGDGLAGVARAKEMEPDAIVLDLMLPGMDGKAVFKALQRDARTRRIPVLMLTAKAQLSDKINGLEQGAADYLTKPFSPRELVLRVQSIMRRGPNAEGSDENSGRRLKVGDFDLDFRNLSLYLAGEEVDLTSTEFKLLTVLAESAGSVQERAKLLLEVWGYDDDIHTRTLDTHIKRLREKLGDHGAAIETVRGVGYRLAKPKSVE